MAARSGQSSISRPTTPGGAPHTARHRPKVRRRYELGSAALVYIGITLLIALGAFNSQNNLLFWAFGLALAALLVSGLISGSMLMGVDVARESIGDASVGENMRVRYRVRNTNRVIPIFALSIEELGFVDDSALPPPGGWISRVLSTRRQAVRSSAIRPPRTFVTHVGPGETVHVEAAPLALRRGPVQFSIIAAHSSFPFGLMRKTLRFEQPAAAVVRPAIVEPDTAVLGGSAASGLSGAVARRPGPGDEFFSLRDYAPGDGPRGIAWAASARRGALLVRQNAAPSPIRLWIVLRLRPEPESAVDDERAISLAAGLAQRAESLGMDYGLSVPLSRSVAHPRRGSAHLARLMTELGLLDLGADDGRGRLAAFPPHAATPGTLCVVVHSGGVDSSFKAGSGTGATTHIGTLTSSRSADSSQPRSPGKEPIAT